MSRIRPLKAGGAASSSWASASTSSKLSLDPATSRLLLRASGNHQHAQGFGLLFAQSALLRDAGVQEPLQGSSDGGGVGIFEREDADVAQFERQFFVELGDQPSMKANAF